jgi:hypothetical protein
MSFLVNMFIITVIEKNIEEMTGIYPDDYIGRNDANEKHSVMKFSYFVLSKIHHRSWTKAITRKKKVLLTNR